MWYEIWKGSEKSSAKGGNPGWSRQKDHGTSFTICATVADDS